MSNLLSGIEIPADVVEATDSVGSGSMYDPVPSGIYEATVKHIYLKKSAKGALGMFMEFELDNGKTYRETVYLTSQKGLATYVDKKDGKTLHKLPGYITGDDISLLGSQIPVNKQSPVDKIIKLYDFDLKKEVPTTVDMLDTLTGKKVTLGILLVEEPKQVKNAAGVYVNVTDGTTREKNEIDKVFHPKSGLTTAEIRSKITEPEFKDKWKARWEGQVKVVKAKGSASASAAPKTVPVEDLFK